MTRTTRDTRALPGASSTNGPGRSSWSGSPASDHSAHASMVGIGQRAVVVMEDLGEGGCLADLLFGADPRRAEAGLVEAAATVGQLHAASVDRAEEYRELRAALGAYDWDFCHGTAGRK